MKINSYFRFFKNYLLNTFTPRKIPYSAQIEITLRCNAKCPFCAVNSFPDSYVNNEMTTDQIKTVIDQLARIGINALSITGGEPTLRKDLPEIISYLGKEHDFITGITSNGYLLPDILPKLEGLDYILTSIDYPTAELHDKSRGIKVFDKVIKSIEIANKKNIKVIISTVVMKDNLHLLEDICQLAERLNCAIELYPCEDIIWNLSGKSYHVENIQNLIPNLSEWANKIRRLRTKFQNILTDPLTIDIVEKGGFGGIPRHQEILRCYVAEMYLFIRHDGYIDYPCKIHPIKSYNLFNHSLFKIYNSQEVIEIMNQHDNFSFCNGCRLGCAIMASIPKRWTTIYSKYLKGYFAGNLN
jgi:MoaA/NifB/PqqE/SkfB family radical SAM enzyme